MNLPSRKPLLTRDADLRPYGFVVQMQVWKKHKNVVEVILIPQRQTHEDRLYGTLPMTSFLHFLN